MNNIDEVKLYQAIRTAVIETVEIIGYETIRETSMFPSSKWNNIQDNTAHKKAA